MLNLTWQGFEKKTITRIEANAGMAERLVRDLAIEEALQEEIKYTLERKNQSYGEWCAQTDKGKNNNKVKLNVTRAGRRYHLGVDITPPSDTPSSSGQGERGSSEWSYIKRPSGSVMLWKREEKKQKNMSAQRTSREARKVWRLLKF